MNTPSISALWFVGVLAGLPVWPAGAAERALPDFSALVTAHGPAVVNISSTQSVQHAPGGGLDRLLRHFGENVPPEYFDSKSLGSGFLVSGDGYILTCAHVVENARETVVRLTDRREFPARVIGADRKSDVALLKIEASGLPRVTTGDPERLKVGEWVLAIGAPFGFESSATAGIVSAKGRSLPEENYIPFIQTDVAINPGNSGGPLFNLKGEVIGVNSQIYSRTGGFMGVSFAVPIDIALQIAAQLKAEGRVRRGWLGIAIQDVTRELAESFGMKKPHGALIADILPGGPAAGSDLRPGDVVMEFEGNRIQRSADLPLLVGKTPIGTRARLNVLRQGAPQSLVVTIGELPEESAAVVPATAPPGKAAAALLGLGLSESSAAQRRELGVSHGVFVDQVGDGPGQSAGVRRGDMILEIDGRAVRTVADFRRFVAQRPKDRPTALLIRRGGGSLFLALKPGA